jgi:hypothetical protein
MGGLIAVEEKETHAVIRLDRPEKKNAMNRAARRELLGTRRCKATGRSCLAEPATASARASI